MSEETTPALAEIWLRDQSIAFAATLLGEIDEEFEDLPAGFAKFVTENIESIRKGLLSDSTLKLVETIDEIALDAEYLARQGHEKLPAIAPKLAEAVVAARKVLGKRDEVSAKDLNRVLISHAVYLLKRRDLPAAKILTWLHRAAPGGVKGIHKVLESVASAESDLGVRLEEALAGSRDPERQTRHRLDEIDKLYDLVLDAGGDGARKDIENWWARICMAYRSSLFCWPLLAEKREERGGQSEATDRPEAAENPDATESHGRGLSLPISLFVVDDGESTFRIARNDFNQRIWFKYKLSKAEEDAGQDEPRFLPGGDGLPPHMEGFRFGFTKEWWAAFSIGVDVAKKLWSSQNGRLRYADKDAADAKLRSSLNVDLRAACDIVEAVYSCVEEDDWDVYASKDPAARYFIVEDRSAEAYWVQCVLGLLLPAREVPMGLCTGVIEYNDGEFEMQDVEGVAAKLAYANRAGVPRVVVPGDRREFYDESETEGIRSDAQPLFGSISDGGARKTFEMNYARTARAAADAMQPSGWRRTNFLRTIDFQKTFAYHQRRLFLRDALTDTSLKRRLRRVEIDWYLNRRKWFGIETEQLERLDQVFLSDTDRSVKYVKADTLAGKVPGLSAEETVGKWVAWKDNQVRSGEETGYRGPGLGVLTMRTAEGDHEVRLWAALAEMLDASASWWDRFQWSDLPKSADLLAQLLCNQRADPIISEGSAPDLLIIFDDANITQNRTNLIFPRNFHHQFYDLLNPGHQDNHKRDYLDEALKRHGHGVFGHPIRIIIVLPTNDADQPNGEIEIKLEDRDLLERMAVFRFGSTRQAAFSMANYGREESEWLGWKEFELMVDRLIQAKLLASRGNILHVPTVVRQKLGTLGLNDDPAAHHRAAQSLCPILLPRGVRISGNRDRQLEPENVLEASWHLQRAHNLVPNRFRARESSKSAEANVQDSQAFLTFLRTSPDWDTVKRLRVNPKTRHESLDLCEELFEAQLTHTGTTPGSTTTGLQIETQGYVWRAEPPRAHEIEGLADDISSRVKSTVETLNALQAGRELSRVEWKRRLRHLYSRQVYALRMLGLPLSDRRLKDAMACLKTATREILQSDFISTLGDDLQGLLDFPISYFGWQCLWNDGRDAGSPNKELTLAERSRFALAAAKSNIAQNRAGRRIGNPWDEPWIAYFILTRPEDIAPAQIAGPLLTWSDIYGGMDAASEFGRRVLNSQQHAYRRRQNWQERHLRDIVTACTNLWSYVTHDEPDLRLIGRPVGPALKLINVLALPETLPAFGFIQACGPGWLKQWPKIATTSDVTSSEDTNRWPAPAMRSYGFVAEAWRDLARSIIGHNSGWIAMLGSLDGLPNDEARLALVRSWLGAFKYLELEALQHSDPEMLLSRAAGVPSVEEMKATAVRGTVNAAAIFKLKNGRRPALYGDFRYKFSELKQSLQPFSHRVVT